MHDVALFITTHNRPRFLRRQLAFLSLFERPCPVVVIDTSEAAARAENARLLRAYRGLRLEHAALPPATTHADAVRQTLETQGRPLVAFCHDDDLLSPAFVERGADFLRAHPDYATCCGRYCLASAGRKEMRFLLQSNFSIEDRDPLDRCVRMLEGVWPCFFGVHRLGAAKLMMEAAQDFPLRHDFQELTFTAAPLLAGKLKVLDEIGAVHVIHQTNLSTRQAAHRGLSLINGAAPASIATFLRFFERNWAPTTGLPPLNDGDRARLTRAAFSYFASYHWIITQALERLLDDYWHFPVPEARVAFREALAGAFFAPPIPLAADALGHRQHFGRRYQFVIYEDDFAPPVRPQPDDSLWLQLKQRGAARLCELLLSAAFHEDYARLRVRLHRELGLPPGLSDILLREFIVETLAGANWHDMEPAADIAARLRVRDPASDQAQFLGLVGGVLLRTEPVGERVAEPPEWLLAAWKRVRRWGVRAIRHVRRQAFLRRAAKFAPQARPAPGEGAA